MLWLDANHSFLTFLIAPLALPGKQFVNHVNSSFMSLFTAPSPAIVWKYRSICYMVNCMYTRHDYLFIKQEYWFISFYHIRLHNCHFYEWQLLMKSLRRWHRKRCFKHSSRHALCDELVLTHASHDDVIKWKHFRVTGPLCGEFTGPRWIPHTKASDAELWFFSLICAWINGWVSNRKAGDLRRYRAHYDVIVMKPQCTNKVSI